MKSTLPRTDFRRGAYTRILAGILVSLCLSSSAFAQRHAFWPTTAGQQDIYSLTYSTATKIDTRLAPSGQKNSPTLMGAQLIDVQLSATLFRVVLEHRPDESIIFFWVNEPKLAISSDGIEQPNLVDKALEGLDEPFLVRMDSSGQPTGLFLGPKSNSNSQALLRTVVSKLVLVSPRKEAQTWKAAELGLYGPQAAHYLVQSSASASDKAQIVLKGDVQILPKPYEWRPGAKMDAERFLISGVTRFEIDPDGIKTMRSSEELKITLHEKPISDGRSLVELKRIETSQLNQQELEAARTSSLPMLESSSAISLDNPIRDPRARRAVLQKRLAGIKLPTLLGSVSALPSGNRAWKAGLPRISRQLAAIIELQPDSIKLIAGLARNAASRSGQLKAAINGLVQAGSPAAQAALVDVARANLDVEEKLAHLVLRMADLDHPGSTVTGFLIELATTHPSPSMRSTALVSLGGCALLLRKHEAHRAQEIADFLEQGWQANQDPATREIWIRAMGNTGHVSAFDTVSRELQLDHEATRLTAISALRWMPIAQAEMILVNLLVGADDEVEMKTVMTAFDIRPCSMALLQRLLQIHQTSFFESLRKAIVSYLWEQHHADERVRKRLERILWERGAKDAEQAIDLLDEDA